MVTRRDTLNDQRLAAQDYRWMGAHVLHGAHLHCYSMYGCLFEPSPNDQGRKYIAHHDRVLCTCIYAADPLPLYVRQ